jgi:hypothetical protein
MLKENEAGCSAAEICREHGISQGTFTTASGLCAFEFHRSNEYSVQ